MRCFRTGWAESECRHNFIYALFIFIVYSSRAVAKLSCLHYRMVTTRNQGSRVDGAEPNASRSANREGDNGPTVAEMAELLKNVSVQLERTKADLQNVINQRDAFARALENSADEYSDRRTRDPTPTRSVTGNTSTAHSHRRRNEEVPDPNVGKERVVVQEPTKEDSRAKEFRYESFTKCGAK